MTRTELKQKDIHALQELAYSAPGMSQPRIRKPRSRAALLNQIDILSRWGAAGLSLVAGFSIVIAVGAGRLFPMRAAVWALMLLATLWTCRYLNKQFRMGGNIAARPFRWRATYTSCLSVLGVVFACAPILLGGNNAVFFSHIEINLLVLFGAFGAAIFHSAHLSSAAAILLPAVITVILTSLRFGHFTSLVFLSLMCVIAISSIFLLNRQLAFNALQRHPRTKYLRKELPSNGSGQYVGDPVAMLQTRN